MDIEELVDGLLAHHGVKGQKWGVRKNRDSEAFRSHLQNVKPPGITMRKDGSMSIKKGANLSRIAHLNNDPFPIKDLTYATVNAYDTSSYIKELSGGPISSHFLWGGGRDAILSMKARENINAPSVKEARKIYVNALVKDSNFREHSHVSNRTIAKMAKDPDGRTARWQYETDNRRLIFDENFDKKAPAFRKEFVRVFQEKGYNAVRDENDAGILSVAPIVIFHPEKSLKVVRVSQITKQVRQANKETVKMYDKKGKDWINRQMYSK